MNNRAIRIWFVFLILVTFSACHKQETGDTKNKGDKPAQDVSLAPLQKALSEIPPGSKILTEEEYKPLVPPFLNALDFYSYYKLYRYPDTRIDPFDADFILVHESLEVEAILAPPKVWERQVSVRPDDERVLSLLKRTSPLSEALLAPVPAPRPDALVSIPGGTLRYRSMGGETVETTVKDFRMDRFETTHHQFTVFLNESKIPLSEIDTYYSLKDPASKIVFFQGRYRYFTGYENLPVFNVSFYGAEKYCSHFGKRLPTNAEWYLAAGHGDGRLYPWGNETDFAKRANFQGDLDGYLLWAPVDGFPSGKSPYGVYNLSGNMFEWTQSANLIGGCFELESKEGRLDFMDQNKKFARNLHDGFRCVSDH